MEQADFDVVGDAGSGKVTLEALAERRVTVVITELTIQDPTGLEFLDALRERHPEVRALVLTDSGAYEHARAAFAAGAAGFALKSSGHDELLAAIRCVAGGGRYVNAAMASRIVVDYLGNLEGGPASAAPPVITKRERDVLTRVANGQVNREIADDLGLSIWTVRKHRQNLMQKFSLHNSADVTAFAIGNGLVPVDPRQHPRRS
jgi:DNA-binding NarL/FixJ family response regulator